MTGIITLRIGFLRPSGPYTKNIGSADAYNYFRRAYFG